MSMPHFYTQECRVFLTSLLSEKYAQRALITIQYSWPAHHSPLYWQQKPLEWRAMKSTSLSS